MPVLVSILLLPFIQVGVSYYLSVQVLILAVLLSSKEVIAGIVREKNLPRLFIAYGMLCMPILYHGYANDDIARSLREALSFYLIAGAFGVTYAASPAIDRAWVLSLGAFTLIMLMVVSIQTVLLARGIYFGLPKEFFVINTSTLPDELSLIYSKVRPFGTFGEPSYLSVVCFTFIFALAPMWHKSSAIKMILVMLWVTVVLSRSMSGIVFCSAIIYYYIIRHGSFFGRYLFIVGSAFVFAIVAAINISILERVSNVVNGSDYSFNARVLTPIASMPALLESFPFGIPGKRISQMSYVPGIFIPPSHLTHNGMLNFIINYGLFGFIPLLSIFYFSGRSLVYIYFVIVLMMQNGGFLTFDKVCLIIIGIILHKNFSKEEKDPDTITRYSLAATARP